MCIRDSLWADGTTEDWEREIFSSRHSLYPVCRDTTDKVVGILDIKDYFALPEDVYKRQR